MVVEHKGYRGRWLSSSFSAGALDPNVEPFEGSPSDACHTWEHVEPYDSSLFYLPEDDIDVEAAPECNSRPADAEEVGKRFMRPEPKAMVSPSEVLSSVSSAFKRTADEMVSMQVHRLTPEVKQVWQMGPLASLFFKAKTFLRTDATSEQDGAGWDLRS